jgi:hypothetical protein
MARAPTASGSETGAIAAGATGATVATVGGDTGVDAGEPGILSREAW